MCEAIDQKRVSPKPVDIAYVLIVSGPPGQRIGLVRYLDNGYYLTRYDNKSMTLDSVEALVKRLNTSLGMPIDVAEAMHNGSVFGWRTPSAQRALEYFGAPNLSATLDNAANTRSDLIALAVTDSMLAHH